MPIEISNRELIWRTLFCMKASQKGIECYLGTKREINYLMDKVGPFVYIDKGFHKGVSQTIYQRVKENGGIIVSLDEEGAIDFEDQSTLKVRYDEDLFNDVSLVCFWGENQLRKVKDNISDLANTIVTGHPRFEYLKPDYHYLYEKDKEQIKNKYGNFILINTNMGFGNNYRGKEFIISNYSGRFKNIQSIINNDEIKLKAYIELIIKLADIKGRDIVIRPHPEENKKIYENTFQNHKNINVIYDKSVIPWILASDVMIHPDCTTGVESLMLGKKSISFLPKGLDESLLTILPIKASHVFNSKKKLVEYINLGESIDTNVDWAEYSWLKNSFNFSASITNIIISEILKIIKTNNNHSQIKKLTSMEITKICLRYYYHMVKNPYDKLLNNKIDGFKSKNITQLVKTIKNNNPIFNTITVKKLNKHLYQFSQ